MKICCLIHNQAIPHDLDLKFSSKTPNFLESRLHDRHSACKDERNDDIECLQFTVALLHKHDFLFQFNNVDLLSSVWNVVN